MWHTRRWWNAQRQAVAHAIAEAESTTGHQVLVWVGKLGDNPGRVADQIAGQFAQASIVFCVDPRQRKFEIRWAVESEIQPEQVAAVAQGLLASGDLPAAVQAVAALLPARSPSGEKLPDIVEEP